MLTTLAVVFLVASKIIGTLQLSIPKRDVYNNFTF